MDPNDRLFKEQQHRFRGLVSAFRSKRFVKDRKVARSHAFRSNLSTLFLDVRAEIPSSRFREMLEWISDLAGTQVRELSQIPIEYDDLSGIYKSAPILPLMTELEWVCERLRVERNTIRSYLNQKAYAEEATFAGRYEEAILSIKQIQDVYGVSLWSVQLRLALEHQAGGLERQKQYSAEVRAVHKFGLLGFVAYFTSVRNEDRTTLYKFLDDVESRLENHLVFADATKTYLRFRLKNELPITETELADVLRVEQNHGIIDLYETFVCILQHIVSNSFLIKQRTAILSLVQSTEIADPRLDKIAWHVAPTLPHCIQNRETKVSEHLFNGRLKQCVYDARATIRKVRDPWILIYAGYALAHSERDRPFPVPKPTTIARMIGHVENRCEYSEEAWAKTTKLTLNYSGLPIAAGVLSLLHQLRRPSPGSDWKPWLIGLNSATFGAEDVRWDCAPVNVRLPNARRTNEVWTHIQIGQRPPTFKPAILAHAVGCVQRGEISNALEALGESVEDWPKPLHALRSLIQLHAWHGLGDRQKVIELISKEGARSLAHSDFMPIEATLSAYSWEDFKLVDRQLSTPIALHLLWSRQEDGQTLSRLRFSTGAALRNLKVNKPSKLFEISQSFDHHELVYFLDNVCVPEILDTSMLFASTRELLEERLEIVSKLQVFDTENSSHYSDEVMHISNQLALDEGKWIVDSTRIHVDNDSMVRWALRELEEDFNRYRDLASLNVTTPQSFDDVIRGIVENTPQKPALSPDNEADAVLLNIVKKLSDEFLTNSTYGLDYFLSKRIRHQSFIGLIRGPLEFSNLITTKDSETGEYHRNDVCLNRFTCTESEKLNKIDDSLKIFSRNFDNILTTAKDNYFHVQSQEKPDGMIVLPISEALFSLIKAVATVDVDLRNFLSFSISTLWAALETSLSRVRKTISEDIKNELIASFDSTRATVRSLAEGDPGFLGFDADMGRISNEVQVKLDEAAQWFVHADTVANSRTFTLEQCVEIGLAAVQKTQRGYSPQISHRSVGEVALYAGDLVFVHDALFVGLGNVFKHSGLKDPCVDIVATWNEVESTLEFEIESDCRTSARIEKEKRANEIRNAIESGSFSRRTRSDSGSGFAKLAASVKKSNRGNLKFYFTEQGRFKLEITYSVVLQREDL
ncbi:hypothetical protein [Hwanghaeella sp. LZ110]|uniref:hypothetical protein n=1 Tax=Hwanghaeella sp. LZ110 TaxID=3402810 RepID=UPI003B66BFF2